jgi:hypothetical protein
VVRLVVYIDASTKTGSPRACRYAFARAVRDAVIRAVLDYRLDSALAEEFCRALTTEEPRR